MLIPVIFPKREPGKKGAPLRAKEIHTNESTIVAADPAAQIQSSEMKNSE